MSGQTGEGRDATLLAAVAFKDQLCSLSRDWQQLVPGLDLDGTAVACLRIPASSIGAKK